jgi:hypothetical protein
VAAQPAQAGTGGCAGAYVIDTVSIGNMFNCTLDTAGGCTSAYGRDGWLTAFPNNLPNATTNYVVCVAL